MIPSNIPATVQYSGTGTTKVYDFPFRAEALSDIQVSIVDETTGEEQTFDGGISPRFTATFDFFPLLSGEVTLVAFTPGPGDLIYLDGSGFLKSGFVIVIRYKADARQPTQFRDTNNMTPVNVEKGLDRLTMAIKAAIDLAKSALRIPSGGGDIDPVFPPLIGNENRGVYVNPTATGFQYGPTVGEINDSVNAAAQSAVDAAQSATDAANQVQLAEDQVALAEQAVTDAQGYATAAASSASDSAAQVALAAAQVALATTQAGNSATSAAASAASAVQSEVSANRTLFTTIVNLDFSDSPFTVTNADKNTMYRVDTTGGSVTITLPLMSTVDPDFKIGVVKTAAANLLTVSRNIGNTINSGGDVVISDIDFGLVVWPIFPGVDWRARYFILESSSGGSMGGGTYTFAAEQVLGVGDQIAPIASTMQWLPVKSSGGEVILDIDLFNPPPVDGSTIVLEGTDDTDYCVIPFSDTAGGFVGNGDIYLKKYVTITLVYDEGALRIKQIGGNGK